MATVVENKDEQFPVHFTQHSSGKGEVAMSHVGHMINDGYLDIMNGGRIVTDRPGRVVGALVAAGVDWRNAVNWVTYKCPTHQSDLMAAVRLHRLTNADIASRSYVTLRAAQGWTGDPWSKSHQPIPIGKLRLLQMSIEREPPGGPSGLGRPRRLA